MGDKSSIEWLQGGATWNPVRARRKTGIVIPSNSSAADKSIHSKVGWACVHASPGCLHCYAEKQNIQCGTNPTRHGTGLPYNVPALDQVGIFLDEKTLLQPLSWRKPRLIFPCSMTDWMADFIPDEFRDKMLAVMALTPQHTYLTLTKRADRQREYFSLAELYGRLLRWADWIRLDTNTKPAHVGISDPTRFPLKNNWRGVSCENQEYADKRIPELLQTPAAVRWISAEPLLGSINLVMVPVHDAPKGAPADYCSCALYGKPRLDWAIVGGESGPGARPCDIEWIRGIRDQCKAAGVACFVKQLGAKPIDSNPNTAKRIVLTDRKGGDPSEWPEDLRVRQYPEVLP